MWRSKKISAIAAFFLTGVLLLSGCSQTPAGGTTKQSEQTAQNVNVTMGRFVEQQVTLPLELQGIGRFNMSQSEDIIRIGNYFGGDIISKDNGESFEVDTHMPEALTNLMNADTYVADMLTSANGTHLLNFYDSSEEDVFDGSYRREMITADNQVIELPELSNEYAKLFVGGDNQFYAVVDHAGLYQIDSQTGAVTYLHEVERRIEYLSICGDYILEASENQLQIYNLKKKEWADEDKVLSDFLANELSAFFTGGYRFLIHQGSENDSIYVLTEKGLYQHVLYGDMMEQVIDGSLCSIGDVSLAFMDLAIVKSSGTEQFLILFTNGTLKRFTYDPTIPTVPDKMLRVFGMYEDENVKRAISAFQQNHPDLYIKYEIGISEGNGVTASDALKNLSTELAAGKGPDILMMDNIPYSSYVEKGVLMDISSFLEEMEGEEFYDNVLDCFRVDNKLYTIPLTFSFALLAGQEEEIKEVKSLADLADIMERTRAQQPQGSLIGISSPETLLALLSQNSCGTWVNEDGSLNTEAVTEFLTQSKRIYDAQFSGLSEKDLEVLQETKVGVSSTNSNRMKLYNALDSTSMASLSIFLEQPFSIGYCSGAAEDFSFYVSLLRETQSIFQQMPGQQEQTCLPYSLLAVNQATAMQQEAKEFLQFTMSQEFQSTAYLTGICINKKANLEKQKERTQTSDGEAYGAFSMDSQDGKSIIIDVYEPNQEEYNRLSSIIEQISQVSICDEMVYETVLDLGTKAVSGEARIEEMVNEIEKKVQIYLAE